MSASHFPPPKRLFPPLPLLLQDMGCTGQKLLLPLSKPYICALGQRELTEGKAHPAVRAFIWEVAPGSPASLSSLTGWSSLSTPMTLGLRSACRHRQESWLLPSTRLAQGCVAKGGKKGRGQSLQPGKGLSDTVTAQEEWLYQETCGSCSGLTSCFRGVCLQGRVTLHHQ